jgi:carbon monoxide dehydrogenase subunit G
VPAVVQRALVMLAVAVPVPVQAAEVLVAAVRHGDTMYVEASAELEAGLKPAWDVLTDYDRLAQFIPGMLMSRVTARTGNLVTVEQRGEAGLLFFSYILQVTLAIEEVPYRRIMSRAVAGNVKEMQGAYQLEAQDGRVRLRYSGTLTPDFSVPPLVGTLVLKHSVERQFHALVAEIAARDQRLRAPR